MIAAVLAITSIFKRSKSGSQRIFFFFLKVSGIRTLNGDHVFPADPSRV